MIISAWNSWVTTQTPVWNEIRALVRREMPDVLFLFETKAGKKKMGRLQHSIRFDSTECVPAIGLSGGLAIFWNNNFDFKVVIKEHICLGVVLVYSDPRSQLWHLLYCYGPHRYRDKKIILGIFG